jgi:hypothetical protein
MEGNVISITNIIQELAWRDQAKHQDGRHAGRDSDWVPPNTSQKRYRLSQLAR